MLTIRKEQMEALASGRMENFRLRTAGYMASIFPDAYQAAGHAIGRARQYGLVTERHVFRYIRLMALLGVDFDTRLDWAREILTDPDMQPDSKTEELFRQASAAPPQV